MENWKDIVGFEGKYQVSNIGGLRRLEHLGRGRYGASKYPAKVIIPTKSVNKRGYTSLSVSLPSERGRVTRIVAHIVAEAFIGPRPEKMSVCHIDGDSTNNSVENLRYDTHAGNMKDTIAHGTSIRGERHPMRVLTPEQVKEIKCRLKNAKYGEKAAMSREFGVSPQTINNIRRGQAWGWLSGDYI